MNHSSYNILNMSVIASFCISHVQNGVTQGIMSPATYWRITDGHWLATGATTVIRYKFRYRDRWCLVRMIAF